MTVRMAALASISGALILAGCGGESGAACGNAILKGDFTLIAQTAEDPATAVAIKTAARVTRNTEVTFAADYLGYEGKTRSDGARCFQFVPKSCAVGGGVMMCVTPSLEPQDVTASE
jgi:hypothetical protein